MKIRFQADESLSDALIQAVLRLEPAIEFITAQQAGVLGFGDPAVLAVYAAGIYLSPGIKRPFPCTLPTSSHNTKARA